MEIIIEQAKVIFPGDPYDQKTVNIKIKNGIIEAISSKKIQGENVIKSNSLCVSPGWVDIGTQSGEPGYEHRETLESLSHAASAGGYTTLAVFPNTLPVIQSKSEIEFIKQKSKSLATEIIPIGAISKELEGKELAELIDMHTAGAIAFSDGKKPIQDTGVLLRALLYAKHFDGLLINQPQDESLASLGQMHEGQMSQKLGLKGIPEIAETIMLKRDLELAEYLDAKLLSHLISTEESVALLKQIKRSNRKIFTSVGFLNLVLTDKSLDDFDSVFKQSPPLRSEKHKKALLKGLQEGTIDIICSNHRPLEIEKKDLEFAYAAAGSIGLQIAFASVNTESLISLDTWVKCVAINPSKILGLSINPLEIGRKANLTIFDPTLSWHFEHTMIKSISKNSPFVGSQFTGKVIATLNKGQVVIS